MLSNQIILVQMALTFTSSFVKIHYEIFLQIWRWYIKFVFLSQTIWPLEISSILKQWKWSFRDWFWHDQSSQTSKIFEDDFHSVQKYFPIASLAYKKLNSCLDYLICILVLSMNIIDYIFAYANALNNFLYNNMPMKCYLMAWIGPKYVQCNVSFYYHQKEFCIWAYTKTSLAK